MAIRNLDWNFYCKHDWSPPLASPFLSLLHWWGSNRWGDRARGWWECKKCNLYSSASLLSFTAGVCVCVGGEGVGETGRWRTGSSWASFASQSALMESTSYTGFFSMALFVVTLPLVSTPVSTIGVNFYSPFTACLSPPSIPALCVSLLSACNVERWWIDVRRRREEPIWIGVSAYLYQTSQRYILLLCFITLEWLDLKCLTALSPPHHRCPSFSGSEL